MSQVWKYFEKRDKKVKCKLYGKELSYNSGSTGSMLNHLKLVHPMENRKDDAASTIQPKLHEFFTSARKCDKSRSKEIVKLITQMVVIDLMPIKCVERQGFKALINFLEPRFEMPSKKMLTAYVNHLYDEKKEALKKSMASEEIENISLTTDSWMASTAESYMTITSHYIDENWELKSAVLATRYVEVSHSAEHLKLMLETIANEFDVTEKILACVHDNAANIELAMKQCETVRENIGCVAHTLQLCVNSGFTILKGLAKTISAASRLVGHFKRSYKATLALKEKQCQINIPQHKLIQCCTTRWNSTYDMFDRLVEQRWAITAVLSDRTVTKLGEARTLELKDEQWSIMEEMIVCLKPLKLATTAVSADKSVSISIAAPILEALVNQHLIPNENDSSVVHEYKGLVKNEIKRRYSYIFSPENSDLGPLIISAFLDPRHKHLPYLSEQQKKKIHEIISTKIMDMSVKQAKKKPKQSDEDPLFLLGLLGENYVKTADDNQINELEQYALLPPILPQEDPLLWWKQYEEMFPNLSRLAKGYLSIPATSVPSERMFSAAGRLVSKLRSSLSPKNVDMILFLNKNGV